jgi:N6-adenosine-specific RNA methylase IME4
VSGKSLIPTSVTADRVLVKLREAEAALQGARTIHQAKVVADVAAAQELFAHRQRLGTEIEGYAHEIKTYALAKLGELLQAMPKQAGARGRMGPGRGKRGSPVGPRLTDAATYAELGIGKKTATTAQQLASLSAPTRDAIAQRQTTLAKVVREKTKTDQLAKVAKLSPTEGVYDVLVVDPPWQYDRQPNDVGLDGEVNYLTESVEHLKQRALPAAKDAVLWLWTTNAFMAEAHELAHAWGFTVKTILTWDKVHMGLGSWLRNVTEHCLCCVKGHPAVTLTNQTTLMREVRREHSRKPEAFYVLVESLCHGRKWELFARTKRPGWTHEGVEADRFSA